MRQLVALLAALTAIAATGGVSAQAADRAADEAAVRAVIQAFLDTREKNDAAGLAALLTAELATSVLKAGESAPIDAEQQELLKRLEELGYGGERDE